MEAALTKLTGRLSLIGLSLAIILFALSSLEALKEKTEYLQGAIVHYFPDTDPHSLEGRAASYLENLNIITGNPDGTFGGEATVNRAEMAKLILLAANYEISDIKNDGRYTDMEENDWFRPYVMTATMAGFFTGYPDGTFGTDLPINTAEFLKLVIIAFDFEEGVAKGYKDVSTSDWFGYYTAIAEDLELFPERTDYLYPDNLLSRRDVAIAFYKILIYEQERAKNLLPVQLWIHKEPNRRGGR